MANLYTCVGCTLYFSDHDIANGQFNQVTNLCYVCTKKDASPCFQSLFSPLDTKCNVGVCQDSPLCEYWTRISPQPYLDPEGEIIPLPDPPPARKPSPQSSNLTPPSFPKDFSPPLPKPKVSICNSHLQSLMYEAYWLLREMYDSGEKGPYFYGDILPKLRERCPGRLQGDNAGGVTRVVLSTIKEIKAVGSGFYEIDDFSPTRKG